jgi:hypothetical protein
MAKLIIDNGWADLEYIEKYTYGFDQYKELADQYPLDRVSKTTGLDPGLIYEAAKLYATNGPACTNYSASALVHHINGFNSHGPSFACPPLPAILTGRAAMYLIRPPTCINLQALRSGSMRSGPTVIPRMGSVSGHGGSLYGMPSLMNSRQWTCCASWRRGRPIL